MSTVGELFAPAFMKDGELTEEVQAAMAAELGADSLRYLPIPSIARAIRKDSDQLCQACITADYPTPHGQQLYQIALGNVQDGNGTATSRTYESPLAVVRS